MAKLELQTTFCLGTNYKNLEGSNDFNELIDIYVGTKGEQGSAYYTICVISTSRATDYTEFGDEENYLQHFIIMDTFEKEAFEEYIKTIIREANTRCKDSDAAYKFLDHYLKSEDEQWLYDNELETKQIRHSLWIGVISLIKTGYQKLKNIF